MIQAGDSIGYGYVREVPLGFDEAVTRIEAALKIEGFGVLCQIDIQAKLKEENARRENAEYRFHVTTSAT